MVAQPSAKHEAMALAATIHSLTQQVFAALPEQAVDPAHKSAKSALTDALDELQLLVSGPALTLRSRFAMHFDLAACQVALENDFFGRIPLSGGKAAQEIANETGVDLDIVVRILRLLAAQHIFREDGSQTLTFHHTSLSAAVVEDETMKAAMMMQMDEIFAAASLTSESLKSPKSAFEMRFGKSIFEYYEEFPAKYSRFGQAMVAAQKLDRDMDALCDGFDWHKLNATDPVVDVGGADGHISVKLAQSFPQLSFIVQDVAHELLSQGRTDLPVGIDNRVCFQHHDFFKPQPRQRASAYLLRQCLHNWSDDKCVDILRAIVPALDSRSPGARRVPLLINETMLPEPGSLPRCEERLQRGVDMSMLIIFGSRERTERDYRRLLQQADNRYQVTEVHRAGRMGLMEVYLS